MRRPLAVIGFTGLLALVFAAFFGESMAFWAAAGIAVLSLVFLAVGIFCPRFRRYKAVLVACVAAVVFFSSYVLCVQLRVRPVQALDGQSAEIEGVVCELPYESYGKYYYELEVRRVDLEGAPQNFKLRVSSSHALGADIYDKIDATVTFYLPQDGQGFSSRSYAQAQGLYVYAFLHEYEGVGVQKTGERPLYYYALRARQAMTQALFELLPEEQAGLACGVLLGSKQYVPDRVNTDFRDIGVSHLLAVSGMHMAVIGQLLLVLGRALRLPKVLRVIFAAAGVFGFMAVTGFVPSVSRAGIMMLLYLLGLLLGRQPDTLTSLGAAVLILIALNPMAGGDIGLLLSFCATLGMILFAGPIDAWLKQKLAAKAGWAQRLVSGVCGALSATVSATLTTLPVLLAVFGEISLISPLANLLLVFPCTVFLLVVAVAGVVVAYTGLFLASMPAVPLWASPWLPPLFVASALSCGCALLACTCVLTGSGEEFASTLRRVQKADVAAIACELAVLAAFGIAALGGSETARLSMERLVAGDLAPAFWGAVVALGLVAPGACEAFGKRVSARVAVFACAFVLVGGFFLRWCIAQAGMPPDLVASTMVALGIQ